MRHCVILKAKSGTQKDIRMLSISEIFIFIYPYQKTAKIIPELVKWALKQKI